MKQVLRQSNFELLRILAMILNVAAHYVNNSTVMNQFAQGDNPVNYLFLKLIGVWGKTAINPFVMISGFFMCTSSLTPKRFCKIFFEWLFYSWLIYAIFLVSGYESATPNRLLAVVCPFFKGVDVGFTSSFMWFYLGIPVYNLVIKGLDRRRLFLLTAGLLTMFVIPITFFGNGKVFHHVFWYGI